MEPMANTQTRAHGDILALIEQVESQVVGQRTVIRSLILGLLCSGHVLLEGLPGTAKTRSVKALANALAISFGRIQFTPDLLPSDVTGTEVLHEAEGKSTLRFQPGPVFNQIVLADEINRAPAKVQAALLEAMAEGTITVAGQTHVLPELFMVLATQNPIEQEGTYPLPEAQLDRFMFNVPLDYPSYEEELAVVKGTTGVDRKSVRHVLSGEEILFFQQLVRKIPISDNVLEYAVKLTGKTRPNTARAGTNVNEYISWGAGPRASQYLVLGAKCHAAISGKYSPDIEDVQAIAKYVLRHRIVRNYKAEAEGVTEEKVIEGLF